MLALALAFAALASAQTAPVPPDKETVEAVERFLKADVADMTPAYTERKMMCEFSLQVLLEHDKKGRVFKRYFLHAKDPLLALVGEFRSSKHGNHDTNFFGGKIFPTCSG